MRCDQTPPALERERMFCASRGAHDGLEHEQPLDLKVFRSPRDFRDIEDLVARIRAGCEPRCKLALPLCSRDFERRLGRRTQHLDRDFIGHQQLGTRAKAVIREHDHAPS